ncbi:putative cytochrome protein B, partial [Toxoplasma gondii VEG]
TVEAKCVTYLVREVAAGWEFKTLHATTASFVFVCIFVHVSRIPKGSAFVIYVWATEFYGYRPFRISRLLSSDTAIQRMKGSPNRTFF